MIVTVVTLVVKLVVGGAAAVVVAITFEVGVKDVYGVDVATGVVVKVLVMVVSIQEQNTLASEWTRAERAASCEEVAHGVVVVACVVVVVATCLFGARPLTFRLLPGVGQTYAVL